MTPSPPIVVYPPEGGGGRRVLLDGQELGRAFSLYDLVELLNGAGLDAAATEFEDPRVFEWRGGGPYSWEGDDSGG
ncbi:hypothetical protein [Streptomyces sp. WMMB303]|uniref:hypothetical protein n=1 Tax=unclassified Streptomyces TaxID=2593676 RepID=UPI0023EAA039|nr:hypothetical protein [Streptomyces sp. WMMB303]MDF4252698.1 hypothetical protein [Streptomyces sp. WMMB303]